ncbi:MAG: transketolase [Sphingobacteriales bacterium]|jgi:2-oxoisovalerate dehydrogenase E1 component|nr:transketolase [Sphingobacteriales bacterium]MBP9141288.1 transketolase [Chitinophagales bacterium]MDA0198693.1 thiamine pyrophosphate-dependent enzyme [Bacteroidota bacterium]MBK7528106.1 transketolase [Sphingobacteriales bacterium]MBK8679730.1 transketolase [Sphingobacteriales bacterium]
MPRNTTTKQPVSAAEIAAITGKNLTWDEFCTEVLNDFYLANASREMSILGRKEVLGGKAKFGILGDGKEVVQLAMAKVFQNGDFRSGYYRDQTLMMALGLLTPQQFFAQLYANTNPQQEPNSAGRCMNGHYATASLNDDGSWKNLSQLKNSSADVSPTACQMVRAVGLALASKKYRECAALHNETDFSNQGNEITFATIGDASTSEGIFWEAINAAGVLQIPLAVTVYDDGYGISVPKKYQTTKQSISESLSGMAYDEKNKEGMYIITGHGWDYAGLCKMYQKAVPNIRKKHAPALFHIQEVTQQLGHSTSGDHRRYKSEERLKWEVEMDCLLHFKNWIIEHKIADAEALQNIANQAIADVRQQKNAAWKELNQPIQANLAELLSLYDAIANEGTHPEKMQQLRLDLSKLLNPTQREIAQSARKTLLQLRNATNTSGIINLKRFTNELMQTQKQIFTSFLTSPFPNSALKVPHIKAEYTANSPQVNGYEIMVACFDAILAREPRFFAFGEDLGKIGDVNQGFSGLQEKYGKQRVFDTGIREATIVGQGLGMAMRGLRPLAEIQYLDYLLYALQTLSDDAATLLYRTAGKQKAPLIVRTRGHRLEGIWHTGSPMGVILHALRGMYVVVPRNMTQAAGLYNTLLQADDPALVIECLNGYRLKETLPDNIGSFTVPLGVVETLRIGTDLTIVTYGSCCRIVMDAAEQLAAIGIDCEVIDVQSLLPFDLNHNIAASVQKTNRLLIVDEDVPGGASAYILQHVVEVQGAYRWLDSPPATLTAVENRAAYGSDGDYFCKPSAEDIVEKVYAIMNEVTPAIFKEYLG